MEDSAHDDCSDGDTTESQDNPDASNPAADECRVAPKHQAECHWDLREQLDEDFAADPRVLPELPNFLPQLVTSLTSRNEAWSVQIQ